MDSSNDDGICKKCYYDWNHCECQKGQNFADIIHLQQYLNQSGKTLSSLQAAWNFLWALDSEMSLELMEDADDEAMWSQLLTGEIENVGEASMAYAKFLSREKGKSSEELGENQLVFIASSRHEKKIREALAQGNILESARLTEELKTLQDAAALGDLTEVCRIIASLPTSSQSKRIRVSIVEAPTRTPTPTPSSAMITTLDAPLVETPMLTSAAPLVETRKLTPTPMPTSDAPLVDASTPTSTSAAPLVETPTLMPMPMPTSDAPLVEAPTPSLTPTSAAALVEAGTPTTSSAMITTSASSRFDALIVEALEARTPTPTPMPTSDAPLVEALTLSSTPTSAAALVEAAKPTTSSAMITTSAASRFEALIVEALEARTPTPTPMPTSDAPLVEAPTPSPTSAAALVEAATPTTSSAMITTSAASRFNALIVEALEAQMPTPTAMPTSDVPLVEAQSFDAPTTDSLIVERTDPEVTLSSAMAQNLELTRAVSLAKSYWEVLKTHLESKIKEEEEEMDSDEEEMDSDVEIILEKKGIEEDMKNDDEDDDEDDEDFDEDDIKDKDYDPDEDIDEEDDEEEDEDEDQDEDEEKEEDEEMKMALTSTLEVENEGKAEAEAEAEAEAKVVAEAEVAVSASTSQMTALDLAQEGYEESCACDDLTPCGQEGCLQRSDCLDWTFEDLITSPEVAKGSEKLEEEKNCSATLRTLALSDDPEVKKMLEIYSKIVVEICEDDVNNEKLRKERLERCERRLKYWSRERKLKGIRCMTGYLGLNSKMGDDLLKLKKMGNELLRVIDGEESDSI